MTIALAFCRPSGIVLGADTREVISGLKRNVPKLAMRPKSYQVGTGTPCAVFAGAGDGTLIDHLIDKVWAAMECRTANIADMMEAAEDGLLGAYQRLVPAHHPGYIPEQQMLIAAWCGSNQFELVHVEGTVLRRGIQSKAIGCGDYLAKYIEDRFWEPKIDVGDLVPVVTYIVDQARKHVDGCGGSTHVAMISPSGEMKQLERHETKRRSKRIAEVDHLARGIAKMAMDERIDDEVARQEIMQDVERIIEIRKTLRS